MKILFITAGPKQWASSRYRAFWVADELRNMGHDAGVIEYKSFKLHHGNLGGADVYIWQKVADLELIKELDGRHYWDLCDPLWWWEPVLVEKIAQHMDGFVFSTDPLLIDFRQFDGMGSYKGLGEEYKTFYIPDRFKLSHFTHRRKHTDTNPTRFVWYGIAANRVALYAAVPTLERLVANGHGIELTIMDDRPDLPFKVSNAFPIYHVQWSLEKEVQIITSHDIALLPDYPGPWGQLKSDNKKHLAYGCGLPVTRGNDYGRLTDLINDPEYRTIAADKTLEPVAFSAQEWEGVLCAS